MGELNKFLFFYIYFFLFTLSFGQIIIPLTPINDPDEPTVMTKETFTVHSNDGSPIRVTRIGIRRSNKNLNPGGDMRTPLELMRLMDDRINSIFEEIISQTMGLRIIFNDMNNADSVREEKKEENKGENKEENSEDKTKREDKEEKEVKEEKEEKEIIDDKEFELDEDTKDENKTEERKNNENKNDENKNDVKNQENKNDESNKDSKNNKTEKKGNGKKEKKSDNKRTIGKLKVNPEALKPKKKKKKLSYKEVIFSRVCKYIFYSIILFTIYILVRKLLELLEIIDPESNKKNNDVRIDNNKEKNNEDEIKKKEKERENNIIINKKKENKLN